MEFSLEVLPQMEHRASPSLIQFSQILQLDSTEMQQVVTQEVEKNPALELVEREVCMFCGQSLRRGICYDCLRRDASSAGNEDYRAPASEDDFDPLSALLPQTVQQSLRACSRSQYVHSLAEIGLMYDPRVRETP